MAHLKKITHLKNGPSSKDLPLFKKKMTHFKNGLIYHYHALDLLCGCNFDPEIYFESGSKLHIWTFWKWTKTTFWHVIVNFAEKLHFWPRSRDGFQFWTTYKLFGCAVLVQIRSLTKNSSAKLIKHVMSNSFKHFFERKIGHPCPPQKMFDCSNESFRIVPRCKWSVSRTPWRYYFLEVWVILKPAYGVLVSFSPQQPSLVKVFHQPVHSRTFQYLYCMISA